MHCTTDVKNYSCGRLGANPAERGPGFSIELFDFRREVLGFED